MMNRFGTPFFLVVLLASVGCGGGIGNGGPPASQPATATVTPAASTAPTVAASPTPPPTVAASPAQSASPVPAATPTPAIAPSATPIPAATPTPAATRTPAATASPTTTPSPTPSATAGNTVACTDPMSGVSSETWTLSGSALTITLPAYGTWNGTIAYPANSPTGTVIAEGDDQSNFNFAPVSSTGDPAYAARVKDFFMTFRLSQTTTFTGGMTTLLPITITSSCIASGTKYSIDVFEGNTFQYTESAVASAGAVMLNIMVAPNPYPGGAYMNAILSH